MLEPWFCFLLVLTPESSIYCFPGDINNKHEDPESGEERQSTRPTQDLHHRIHPELRIVCDPQHPETQLKYLGSYLYYYKLPQ